MPKSVIKMSGEDRIYDIVIYLIMGIISLLVLYPLYFVLIASISSPDAVNAGKVIFYPIQITFEGYQKLFQDSRVLIGYRNSFFYTFFGTLLNLILTLITAYPLSRKELKGRNVFLGYFLFTMFFSGGLIPTYILVTDLHLYNTPYILILLGAISIFNMIIAKSFFESTISPELLEAAEIDGCGNFRFFVSIVLPLSKALIGVLVVYYGVGHWNEYFNALIYVSKSNLRPLQMILREILIQNSSVAEAVDESTIQELARQARYAELIKYGVIVVASLPVLCVYPFAQKYFTKGVMLGSVKG